MPAMAELTDCVDHVTIRTGSSVVGLQDSPSLKPGFLPVVCYMCLATNRSERLRGSKCRSRSKSKSRFDAVLPALLFLQRNMSFASRVERRTISI